MFDPRVLMAVALAFLVSNAVTGFTAHHYGAKNQKNADIAAQMKAKSDAAEEKRQLEERIVKLNDATGAEIKGLQAQLQTALNTIRVKTVTLIREVPTYVSPLADSRCVVPVGFVRLHDDAVGGAVPNPAPAAAGAVGGLVDEPSGVALSAIGSVVAENYGYAHELEQQVNGWRAHWASVEKWYDQLRREAHVCK
jgi:hypothetical protein